MQLFLQAPFLTEEAAVVAARAASAPGVPVWLCGGPGAAAYEVARALHQGGDPSGFVSVRGLVATPAEIEARLLAALSSELITDTLSLYVERIDRQPVAVQELVLRWIDEGVRWKDRAARVRVLAQSDQATAAARRALLPALRRRLSVLVLPLPPLSARTAYLPGIVRVLLIEIAAGIGRPAPAVSDEALELLSDYEWTDGVEELETVLTRAVVNSSGNRIEVSDLGLTPLARGVSSPLVRDAVPSPTPSPVTHDLERLESIITELAHELKNPMVTIKTFAQHLDHLLGDPDLREKFVRLTTEAIDRMDSFLNELVRFSRFSAPRPRLVSLLDLLSRALAVDETSLRPRVQMNGVPSDVEVRGDEEQLSFAFRALFRGLLRELPADAGIVLDWLASGELVVRSKVIGITRKLQSLLDHGRTADSETSLDFVLADTLIRRNGGTCRTARADDFLEVRLTLPRGSEAS